METVSRAKRLQSIQSIQRWRRNYDETRRLDWSERADNPYSGLVCTRSRAAVEYDIQLDSSFSCGGMRRHLKDLSRSTAKDGVSTSTTTMNELNLCLLCVHRMEITMDSTVVQEAEDITHPRMGGLLRITTYLLRIIVGCTPLW